MTKRKVKSDKDFIDLWPETCSRPVFAKLINANIRRVQDLIAVKVVVLDDKKQIVIRESLEKYIKHLRKTAQGRQGEVGPDLATQRAILTQGQIEEQNMKNAIRRGEYLSLAEVKDAWIKFGTTIRLSVMSLPSKIRAAIPHMTAHDALTIEGICRATMTQAGEELQGGGVPGSDETVLAPDAPVIS